MHRTPATMGLLLLALAPAAAAAQALPVVQLAPGEAVTFRFGEGGRVEAPERIRAEWHRLDLVAARHLAGTTPPDAPVPEAFPIDVQVADRPDPIPPDEVRVRFLSIAGRHSLLVVENGRDLALAYRARMSEGAGWRHTDVCVVLPQLPSYEYWPHPITDIELSDFRFIAWAPGRMPTCE